MKADVSGSEHSPRRCVDFQQESPVLSQSWLWMTPGWSGHLKRNRVDRYTAFWRLYHVASARARSSVFQGVEGGMGSVNDQRVGKCTESSGDLRIQPRQVLQLKYRQRVHHYFCCLISRCMKLSRAASCCAFWVNTHETCAHLREKDEERLSRIVGLCCVVVRRERLRH